MDYSKSRSEYLKLMYGNINNEIAAITTNTMNQLNDTSFDTVELASLKSKQAEEQATSAIQEMNTEIETDENRNWWQRMIDSINNVTSDITEGLFNFFDDIYDFAVNIYGEISGNKEQAKELVDYDWQSQATRAVNIGAGLLTGDAFSSDYWTDWDAEGSRNYLEQVAANSYLSEIPDDWWINQNSIRSFNQSLGYQIPSIIAGIATGGTSTAAQAASLAVMGVGAFAGATNDAYAENGEFGKSMLQGLASAGVEVGSEIVVGKVLNKLGLGVNKVAGIIGSGQMTKQAAKSVTDAFVRKTATKTAKASFAKEMAKTMFEEGTEEVVSALLDPVVSSITEGESAFKDENGNNIYFNKDFWFGKEESVASSFVSGAAMSVVLGGGTTLKKYRALGKTGVAIADKLEENKELNNKLLKAKAKNNTKQINTLTEQIAANAVDIGNLYQEASQTASSTQKKNLATLFSNPQELMESLSTGKDEDIDTYVKNQIEEGKDNDKVVTRNIFNDMQETFGTDVKLEFDDKLEKDINGYYDKKTNTVKLNTKLAEKYAPTLAHEYLGHVISDDLDEKTRGNIFNDAIKTSWYKQNEKKLRRAYIETDDTYKSLNTKERTKYWQQEVINKYMESLFNTGSNAKSNVRLRNILFKNNFLNRLLAKIDKSNDLNIIKNNPVLKEILNGVNKVVTQDKLFSNTLNKYLNGKKMTDLEKKYYENHKETFQTYKQLLDQVNSKEYSKSENQVEKETKIKHNESEEIKYGDDFRRIQEESRRISNQEQQLFHKGSKEVDETLRTRLSRTYRSLLNARSNIISDGYGLLENTGDFKIYSNVEPQVFHDIFEINKTYLKFGELVDLHDNYDNATCYLSDDGLSGFAIEENGNLISVFNLNRGKRSGWLKAISEQIKSNAKSLDCYNSTNQPLATMYSKKFGFKTASLMDYNMEYDHDNIAKNHNMPQVAFMVNTNEKVETKHFNKDQYDEAQKYQLSFVNNKKYSKDLDNYEKDLVAVHNLNETNLKQLMELGGIPMPSVAITKAEYGHDKFGNISLVLKPSAINPASNRNNDVFSADAYSPTFPQVDLTVNSEELHNLAKYMGVSTQYVKTKIISTNFDSSGCSYDLSRDLKFREAYAKHNNLESDNLAILLSDPQYNKYVDDIVNKVIDKKWLRNNKEEFDEHGKRRSFEDLHEEYTAENAVKMMKEQPSTNVFDPDQSVYGIRAAISDMYSSIHDMHKSEYLLKNDIPLKNFYRLESLHEDAINTVRDIIQDEYFTERNAKSNARSIVYDAIQSSTTDSAKEKILKQYNIELTDEALDKIFKLKSEIQQMPREYFEAKPRRVIKFNEIKYAIVPEQTDSAVVDFLEKQGIQVKTYNYFSEHADQDRRNILNSLKDVRFSKNIDSEGNTLSKQQQEFFKDVSPELLDKNGNLKVVYHGTTADFNIFDYDKIGTHASAYGYGFYFTDSRDVAEGYQRKFSFFDSADRLKQVYINITKPLNTSSKQITKNQYTKFLKAYIKYDPDFITNFGDPSTESIDKLIKYATDLIYDNNDNDVNLIMEVINVAGKDYQHVYEILKDTLGYDGIIIDDFNNTHTNTYVAFFPNQIKSVFNTNPTSDPDIRYSKNLTEKGWLKQAQSQYAFDQEDEQYNPYAHEVEYEDGYDKDLIAVHNLSLNSLYFSYAMGGIPMPSVAIQPYDTVAQYNGSKDFGEITIVLDPSLIQPERNSKARIYTSDSWTQRQPKNWYTGFSNEEWDKLVKPYLIGEFEDISLNSTLETSTGTKKIFTPYYESYSPKWYSNQIKKNAGIEISFLKKNYPDIFIDKANEKGEYYLITDSVFGTLLNKELYDFYKKCSDLNYSYSQVLDNTPLLEEYIKALVSTGFQDEDSIITRMQESELLLNNNELIEFNENFIAPFDHVIEQIKIADINNVQKISKKYKKKFKLVLEGSFDYYMYTKQILDKVFPKYAVEDTYDVIKARRLSQQGKYIGQKKVNNINSIDYDDDRIPSNISLKNYYKYEVESILEYMLSQDSHQTAVDALYIPFRNLSNRFSSLFKALASKELTTTKQIHDYANKHIVNKLVDQLYEDGKTVNRQELYNEVLSRGKEGLYERIDEFISDFTTLPLEKQINRLSDTDWEEYSKNFVDVLGFIYDVNNNKTLSDLEKKYQGSTIRVINQQAIIVVKDIIRYYDEYYTAYYLEGKIDEVIRFNNQYMSYILIPEQAISNNVTLLNELNKAGIVIKFYDATNPTSRDNVLRSLDNSIRFSKNIEKLDEETVNYVSTKTKRAEMLNNYIKSENYQNEDLITEYVVNPIVRGIDEEYYSDPYGNMSFILYEDDIIKSSKLKSVNYNDKKLYANIANKIYKKLNRLLQNNTSTQILINGNKLIESLQTPLNSKANIDNSLVMIKFGDNKQVIVNKNNLMRALSFLRVKENNITLKLNQNEDILMIKDFSWLSLKRFNPADIQSTKAILMLDMSNTNNKKLTPIKVDTYVYTHNTNTNVVEDKVSKKQSINKLRHEISDLEIKLKDKLKDETFINKLQVYENTETKKVTLKQTAESQIFFDIADKAYALAKIYTPEIKELFNNIAKKYNLSWSSNNSQSLIKSKQSIADRLKRNIHKKRFSVFDLKDLIRTTFIFDDTNINNVLKVVNELKPYIYNIDAQESEFGYRSNHLNLKINEIPIEIQFHTSLSWKLKSTIGDAIYDKWRSRPDEDLTASEAAEKAKDRAYSLMRFAELSSNQSWKYLCDQFDHLVGKNVDSGQTAQSFQSHSQSSIKQETHSPSTNLAIAGFPPSVENTYNTSGSSLSNPKHSIMSNNSSSSNSSITQESESANLFAVDSGGNNNNIPPSRRIGNSSSSNFNRDFDTTTEDLSPYELNKANEIKAGASEKEGKYIKLSAVNKIYDKIEQALQEVFSDDVIYKDENGRQILLIEDNKSKNKDNLFHIQNKEGKARRLFEEYNLAKNSKKKENCRKFILDLFNQPLEERLVGVDFTSGKAEEEYAPYTFKDYLLEQNTDMEKLTNRLTDYLFDSLNEKAKDSDTTRKINYLTSIVKQYREARLEYRATIKFIKKLNTIKKNLSNAVSKYGNTGQLDTSSGIAKLFSIYFNKFGFTKGEYLSNSNLLRLKELIDSGQFKALLDSVINPNNDLYNLPDLINFSGQIFDIANNLANSRNEGSHLSYSQVVQFTDLNKAIYKLYKDYKNGVLERARTEALDLINKTKEVANNYKHNKLLSILTRNKYVLDFLAPRDIISIITGGTYTDSFNKIYNDLYKKPYENQIGKFVEFLEQRDKVINTIKKSQMKNIKVDNIKMNKYVLFQFYLNSLSPDNTIRMQNSNLTYTDMKTRITQQISYESLRKAAEELLTTEEKADLDALFNLYNTTLKEYVEYTSQKVLGFKVSRQDYYPIVSADIFKTADFANPNQVRFNINAMTNGRLKKLSNTKTKIEINVNPINLYRNYVESMTITGEIGLASQKLNRILQLKNKDGESAMSIISTYLPDSKTYISSMFDKLIGNDVEIDKNAFLNKLMGRFSTATLGFNIRSMLKQIGSFFTAWEKVGITTGLKAMLKPSTYARILSKENKTFLKENNKVFAMRIYDNSVIRAATLSNGVGQFASTAMQKLLSFSLRGMEMMDRFTCYATFTLAQEYAKKISGAEIGTNQNYNLANQLFTDMILETQSNSDRIAMSRIRSGEKGWLVKTLFGLFQSDVQNKVGQFVSLLNDNVNSATDLKDLKSKFAVETDEVHKEALQEQISKITRARKQIGSRARGFAAGIIMSALVVTLADMIADWLYDKEEPEDTDLLDQLMNLLGNTTIDWIPYFNQIWNWYQYDGVEISAVSSINELIESIKTLTSGSYTKQDIINIAMQIAQVFGIPANNVNKLIQGIVGNFSPALALKYKSLFYGMSQTYLSTQTSTYIESGNLSKAKAYMSYNFTTYKFDADEDLINELTTLKQNGYNVSVKNSLTSYTDSGGDTIELSDSEQKQFNEYYILANTYFKSMKNSQYYQSLTMEEKAKAIKKMTDLTHEIAKYKALEITPSSTLGKYYAYASDTSSVGKNIAIIMYLTSKIANSDNKKSTLLKEINKIKGLSKLDKLLICQLMGYSVSETNQSLLSTYLVRKGLSKDEISALM